MSELVQKLAGTQQPISLSRYQSWQGLQQAINAGFVLVNFTDTQGETELGFAVDASLSSSDDDHLQLKGQFRLDFVDVSCEVRVDKNTLCGTGRISVLTL